VHIYGKRRGVLGREVLSVDAKGGRARSAASKVHRNGQRTDIRVEVRIHVRVCIREPDSRRIDGWPCQNAFGQLRRQVRFCGRWRNGVPFALSPDADSPPGGVPPEQMNDFEYVNADAPSPLESCGN
jgi:hypothetical protein